MKVTLLGDFLFPSGESQGCDPYNGTQGKARATPGAAGAIAADLDRPPPFPRSNAVGTSLCPLGRPFRATPVSDHSPSGCRNQLALRALESPACDPRSGFRGQ